jgi:hypothetical protein
VAQFSTGVDSRNFLSHRVYDDYDAVLRACAEAWKALIKRPEPITSIATQSWA